MSGEHPRGFASDNNSGAHPDVIAAIAATNEGHVVAYGEDDYTAANRELFRRHFGEAAAEPNRPLRLLEWEPMSSSRAQPAWRLLSAMVTSGAKCRYCGTRDDLVAHHRVPRRLGGPDLLSNLEPVCRRCHPRVEQTAFAEAELDWVSPVEAGTGPPARRRRPRLIRPY